MSFKFESVTPDFAVAAQLLPAQLASVAAAGFRSVVNNRPDGEGGAEQPLNATMANAARDAGLQYAYLPVIPNDFKPHEVTQMAALLAALPKPVLGFCRSGARSANLYRAATEAPG
ncbi:MAG: TIGR01244 family phosphatase [Gammaproteobacteria bacterium]|nr:TIGR01244 family phosphatase [Gammaproteobacteria bacterium]